MHVVCLNAHSVRLGEEVIALYNLLPLELGFESSVHVLLGEVDMHPQTVTRI